MCIAFIETMQISSILFARRYVKICHRLWKNTMNEVFSSPTPFHHFLSFLVSTQLILQSVLIYSFSILRTIARKMFKPVFYNILLDTECQEPSRPPLLLSSLVNFFIVSRVRSTRSIGETTKARGAIVIALGERTTSISRIAACVVVR